MGGGAKPCWAAFVQPADNRKTVTIPSSARDPIVRRFIPESSIEREGTGGDDRASVAESLGFGCRVYGFPTASVAPFRHAGQNAAMPVTLDAPDSLRPLLAPLRAIVATVVRLERRRLGEVGLRLSDDAELRLLNREWRRIDRATDVISFAYDEA